MAWPTAIKTMSASMVSSGFAAATGAGRPRLTAPMRWGWTTRALALPSTSASMRTGACRVSISTPSAMAASTSSGSAVMSSSLRRYATVTLSAPARTEVRAQSMATLPPPTTTTFLPEKSGYSSSPILPSRSTADMTPVASAPSMSRVLPPWAPMAT